MDTDRHSVRDDVYGVATASAAPAHARSEVCEDEAVPDDSSAAMPVRTTTLGITTPVSGTVVAPADLSDQVFASGAVGQGAGGVPDEGQARSPAWKCSAPTGRQLRMRRTRPASSTASTTAATPYTNLCARRPGR
ncbi:hypothetical protein GCM10010377_55550 [Streptomyces viridiviolaceus]|nr:hypothetical protein GCM10010377_55550 [Streptomyces viridiviolaceus]